MAAGASFVAMTSFMAKSLQCAAPGQRASHRDRIRELQVPAMRDAARNPRQRRSQGTELALEEQCGRLSIDAWWRRHDDLADRVAADPSDQAPDRKVLGADPLEGRQEPAQDEVTSAHRPCP